MGEHEDPNLPGAFIACGPGEGSTIAYPAAAPTFGQRNRAVWLSVPELRAHVSPADSWSAQ